MVTITVLNAEATTRTPPTAILEMLVLIVLLLLYGVVIVRITLIHYSRCMSASIISITVMNAEATTRTPPTTILEIIHIIHT